MKTLILHLSLLQIVWCKCLLREPPDIVTAPQQNDAGFFLEISGAPRYYEAGHLYTVSLRVRTDFWPKIVFQTLKSRNNWYLRSRDWLKFINSYLELSFRPATLSLALSTLNVYPDKLASLVSLAIFSSFARCISLISMTKCLVLL